MRRASRLAVIAALSTLALIDARAQSMEYNFSETLWAAFDATYYTAGSTTLNGAHDNDRQYNSRYGATLAKDIDLHNSVKLYFDSGATARSGANFHTVGAA